MRRKLTAAIFTLSTLTSGLVHALGLGEATVRSSLNQPLNAEIELLSVNELTEREIITALASREDFLRANIERTYFLSDIRFKVEVKPGGGAVIRVSSTRPVREPYLNFLVEVNWPTGRLLREYALLIDPPTFSSEAPAQVSAAPASAPAVSAQPATATQTRARAGTAGSGAPAATTSAPGRLAGAGEYGPTARNDTLWSIAMQTRPAGDISPQQMMLALQDANPDAFIDNNINRLKAGQILRVPDETQARARSSREAVVQVSAQNWEFAGAAGPTERRVDATVERQSGDLTARRATPEKDRLRILVDNEGQQQTVSAVVSGKGVATQAPTEDLAVARERLDEVERDRTDLQGRVGELEDQLETLQRLLTLKDEQLAALQARLGEPVEATTAPEVSGAVAGGMEQTGPDSGAVTPAPGTEQPLVMETGQATGETDDTGAEGQGSSATEEGGSPVAGTPVAGTPVIEEKPQIKTRDKAVAEVTEDNWFTVIKDNPLYQVALAAGGLVLLLVLWLISRSSAKKEHEFLERRQENAEDDKVLDGLDFQERGAEKGAAEASAAVAEADVYIAYKRYDQAARVLQQAATQQPENTDVQMKLLEVAGASRDRALFDSTAAGLLALGVPALTAQVNRLKAEHQAGLEDEGLSLDDLENQLLSGTLPEQKAIAEDLDIDETPGLGTAANLSGQRKPVLDTVETDNLDIDFDLGDIDVDASVNQAASSGAASASFLEEAAGNTVDDGIGNAEDGLAVEALTGDQADADIAADIGAEEAPLTLQDVAEFDGSLEQGLDDDFDLARVEGETPAAYDDPLQDDIISDELLDLERSAEPSGAVDKALEEELALDLDDSDLDISEAGAAADLTDRLDDLEQEIGQIEERLDVLQEDDLPVANADFSDETFSGGLRGSGAPTISRAAVADAGMVPASSALDSDLAAVGAVSDDFLAAVDATSVDATAEPAAVPGKAAAQRSGMQDEFIDDLEEDFGFLAGTDEAATKLDLARAYIDMGDREGARDILEEVIEEGNEQQKQDASRLLEGLS